jgi:hypothetical protein
MSTTVIGWITLALPALLIGGLILKRWKVAQWIFVVAVIAGLVVSDPHRHSDRHWNAGECIPAQSDGSCLIIQNFAWAA